MDELVVPLQEKKSLFDKIKAHKTAVILGSVAFVILLSMTLYLFSPLKNILVSPSSDENLAIPTLIPTQVPGNTSLVAIPPAPTINPQVISWKTYTNPTYKYSIKYPTDWTVKDLGVLEPKIPSYIVFNTSSAAASSRFITISISTRSYNEQLALATSGSTITVAGIKGTKQSFKDSDGNTSTVITLPKTNNLLVLRAKTAYLSIFNLMLTTLKVN